MVELQPSKLAMRVRFPLPAPCEMNLPPKVVLVVQFKGVFIMKTDKSTKIRMVKEHIEEYVTLEELKEKLSLLNLRKVYPNYHVHLNL